MFSVPPSTALVLSPRAQASDVMLNDPALVPE
jgi:hypothetical protein